MTTRRRTPTAPPAVQDSVVIDRKAAFGDVIGATIIADALHAMGHRVTLNTAPVILQSGILRHHPSITAFGVAGEPAHVHLDGTYDNSPLRKTRSVASIFWQHAADQLIRHGVSLGPERNLRPQLRLLPHEIEQARRNLETWPKPWVAVVPKSDHWPNRTTQQALWAEVGRNFHGTLLWTGSDPMRDSVVVDCMCRGESWRPTAALLAVVDLVVGVDTGPMWCAVGVNTPILGLSQARPFRILLNDQVDWADLQAPVDCVGCSEHVCPHNAVEPPCQRFDAGVLSDAIRDRLETVQGSRVSAVIPCLHDKDPRILKCLHHVIDQVDEVVFSLDGAATGAMIPTHPKVRIVRSPKGDKTGFGKTCNRGARAAKGRYLLFLNDDLYLDPGAVRALKSVAAREDAAIVGGLWRYPDGTIQHGGGHRHHGDVGFGHLDWKATKPSLTTVTELEFVTAACILVRREAFYQVGAFGEEFGNYSEDADLCMKVREKGWKVFFHPGATGVHDESQTTNHSNEKQAMLAAANAVFRRKWQRYFTHNPPGALGVFA